MLIRLSDKLETRSINIIPSFLDKIHVKCVSSKPWKSSFNSILERDPYHLLILIQLEQVDCLYVVETVSELVGDKLLQSIFAPVFCREYDSESWPSPIAPRKAGMKSDIQQRII